MAAARKPRKPRAPDPRGPMERAVGDEIERLKKRDPELASGALAAAALSMARAVDNEGNSATSRSMCNRELRETLAEIRSLAPEREQEADSIDDLTARRAKRLAAAR